MAGQNAVWMTHGPRVTLPNMNRQSEAESRSRSPNPPAKNSGVSADAANLAISQGIANELRAWRALEQEGDGSHGGTGGIRPLSSSITDILSAVRGRVIKAHSDTGKDGPGISATTDVARTAAKLAAGQIGAQLALQATGIVNARPESLQPLLR